MTSGSAGRLPDTDQPDLPRSLKARLLRTIPKGLFFYVIVPSLVLWLLARPIGTAVRGSGSAVYWIFLASLCVVGLNWFVYRNIHGKRPSLLVFAHGILCLLVVAIIEQESLPSNDPLRSTLAVLVGYLAIACLLLFSFWLASRRTKFTVSVAVVIWVILLIVFCAMVYQVFREIEVRTVTVDTWIGIGSSVLLLLGAFSPFILSAVRRSASRRRKNFLAEGRIVQIIGETHLDLDQDLVTLHHARIEYSVDDVPYETRTDISRATLRRFGRDAFVGRTIPVFYDPANPADAWVKKLDRHFFKDNPPDEPEADA